LLDLGSQTVGAASPFRKNTVILSLLTYGRMGTQRGNPRFPRLPLSLAGATVVDDRLQIVGNLPGLCVTLSRQVAAVPEEVAPRVVTQYLFLIRA